MADRIDDLPEGWEIIPDPDIAGQHIALNTTHDGRALALVQNEEGRPEISVLVDFALIPPSWAEGDQHDYEGEVMGTFPDLDSAVAYANGLMELPDSECFPEHGDRECPQCAVTHIHQGGTTNTYCGVSMTRTMYNFSWENAHAATCAMCLRSFEN